MDLTTLAAALLVALGLLSADVVMNSDDVVVEVVAPSRTDKISIDEATLEQAFENQLRAIAATQSLVHAPEIRAKRKQSVGMALAEAAKVQGVAYALQTELGYKPDRLRLALFVQNGALRGLITGTTKRGGSFEQVMLPRDDETLPAFVRRTAIWGASQIAPYTTALYLLQVHSRDKDFTDVLALADHAKAKLPPTPLNTDRSLYENLRGLVALFQNDVVAAKNAFKTALAADPSNPVAVLNVAFAEIEVNDYDVAAGRMERLIKQTPPSDHILLATAYMSWAAAEMGLHHPERADALLATALQIDPSSATGYGLWAEVKKAQGDDTAVADLQFKALQATADAFENYAEVAALYFHLSWQDDRAVILNKFADPGVITFH